LVLTNSQGVITMDVDNKREQDIELEEALANYRHKEMLEHLMGPAISLAVHIVMIIIAIFVLVSKPHTKTKEIEVTIEEVEAKEIPPEQLEELQELEQFADESMPSVDNPTQESSEVSVSEDFSDEMAQTDNNMDFSDVLNIKINSSPLRVSGMFGGRNNAGRRRGLAENGGSRASEDAVIRALYWLREHQNKDGSWSSSKYKRGLTGLAVLCFLAHGETPDSPQFGKTVRTGLQWIIGQINSKGYKLTSHGYDNGIMCYALAEAFGMTKLPQVKIPLDKGLKLIIKGQQKRGGWDYMYKKGERWDLSLSAWHIQALKAAYVSVDDSSLAGIGQGIDSSIRFLKGVAFSKNKFHYDHKGRTGWGMQGAGVLCLQLLNHKDCLQVERVSRDIAKEYKVEWNMKKNHAMHNHPGYNWYYCTQVMFQCGGAMWANWNRIMQPTLVQHQFRDGHWLCPGKNNTLKNNDPFYSTILCCLCLEVYYRYLPTFHAPHKTIPRGNIVLNELNFGLDLRVTKNR